MFDKTHVSEFSKDLEKLKIHSIEKDLNLFESAFSADKTKLTGVYRIPGLEKKGIKTTIFKSKKIRCKFLQKGSRSGLRLIFAYLEDEDKLIYIEIYKKNGINHNENRVKKYFKQS